VCSRQCNTFVHHQNDQFLRSMPRHRAEINQYWMCDAGRDLDFFYHNRLEQPLARNYSPLSWEDALAKAASQFLGTISADKTAVFLSSQGSCEEYSALKLLCDKLGLTRITIKNDLAKQNSALMADDFLISGKIANVYAANEIFVLSDIHAALNEICGGRVDTIIYWGHSGGEFSAEVLKQNVRLLQISPFTDELTEIAELALPSLTPLEQRGTFKNIDGLETIGEKAVTICRAAKGAAEIFETFAKLLG
jgi:NADH-quinone oxidoreductase subunit G